MENAYKSSRVIDKAVFETALEIQDLDARHEFLTQVCVGDGTRFERIMGWLDTQEAADAFFRNASISRVEAGGDVVAALGNQLSEKCSELSDTCSSEYSPGSWIGRYRLLERIGEGGYGVVYLAEQLDPVQRKVALKVIRLGLDTESVISRFEMERQALAMMDHTNIAFVLDAGTTDSGRPYFVMELVHGMKITEHCDVHRLGLRQRLELFILVCGAIQHAHQKGVIHRDIKPSNILVSSHDGLAVPKVIDFGVARAIEGRLTAVTNITAWDQFVGTPAYMSPEQAEGSQDADTRSDIYSLGVLLYELLTSRTPFDSKRLAEVGLYEMLKILREEEPPTPSAMLATLSKDELISAASARDTDASRLMTSLRGDLSWIVVKAMAKDYQIRYETVNGLAMDIQRFLDDEPIYARPPSRFYLLGKLIRRNKITFMASTAVAIALIAGLAVSSWFYLREREARHEQEELRSVAESARANEARLLQQSKTREAISQAAMLLSVGKIPEADAQLRLYPLTTMEPSREAADVFRSLGDWNAIHGRWTEAAQCFALLMQANRFVSLDQVGKTIDLVRPGLALLESGDIAGYEKMQRELIDQFSANYTDQIMQQLFLTSLLRPTDKATLESLAPHAAVMVKRVREKPDGLKPWQLLDLALYEYRKGDFQKSLEWADLFFAGKYLYSSPLHPSVHCIAAMAAQRLGDTKRARAELAIVRERMANPTKTPTGDWWDSAFVRIFLSEAQGIVDAE